MKRSTRDNLIAVTISVGIVIAVGIFGNSDTVQERTRTAAPTASAEVTGAKAAA